MREYLTPETDFREETESRNEGETRERRRRGGLVRKETGQKGRKKGNSGKGCTLQQQRSISGFHFVLGVLRRLHATQPTHRRSHGAHIH